MHVNPPPPVRTMPPMPKGKTKVTLGRLAYLANRGSREAADELARRREAGQGGDAA